ncbi:hypothetical protein, conserved [Leishmania donovani]|uniref:Uncharacterized protein n=2 Tax=Leishmania donovani TaxID=5661 RepID=E9BG94_LEIDO|nr:hypothetical protein, conserved [Leishmania donovani]CBZ34270.1 hypothetical protein, conserved [Leishmania donovani]
MNRGAHACASPPLPAAAASGAASPSFRGRSRGNGAHCSGIASLPSPRRNSSCSPHTGTHGHDPADDLAFSVERPLAMSPLALALQAQWRQLQQDMLSPSALRPEDGDARAAQMEDDMLRVLRSIAARADMAVNDAVHTVPYLLALGQVPLPSLRTQVVALAALRGVLSSLSGVYGDEAASAFVHDTLLGEHQALQALSLAALIALEGFRAATGLHDGGSTKADDHRRTSSALGSSLAGVPLGRSGHRSLLSRGQGDAQAEGGALRASWVHLEVPEAAPASLSHVRTASRLNNGADTSLEKPTALRGRMVHATLQLLRDTAEMCGPVADALLSSAALLKACIDSLHRLPPPPPLPVGNVAGLAGGLSTDSSEAIYAVYFHHCEDVVSLLLTLLNAEPRRHNEASLVLCSFDAPRAVCALAQRLVRANLFTSSAVCEGSSAVTEEEASMLLWSALKVLGRLTRGCPAAVRLFLSENASVPAFLVQVLTVPVAEIREAGALWVAALLETQPQASAELVSGLLDDASLLTTTSSPASPAKATTLSSSAPVPMFVASLMEMLRWRGAQMHVFSVSAILCWRWLLLSDPSRVAALLVRDSSLLATLIELILRGAASTSSSSSAALPTRLAALEALHVFALSYALGSIDTRVRLEALVVRGQLSHATLRQLRTHAHIILERTHPAYWNAFPAMEMELLEEEAELSEEMRLAGATVRTCGTDETARGACSSGPSTSSLMRRRGGCGRLAVCISTGAAWRQLVLESVWELTAAVAADASSTAVLTFSSARSSVTRGRAASPQQQQPAISHTSAFHPHAGVFAGGAFGASPIRVLTSASSLRATAAPAHSAGSGVAEDMDGDGSAASVLDASAPPILTRAPRTIREATLLPTRQSTTAFRFRVVQQAENLDGIFVQDSMRVVLRLAQHYTQTSTQSRASAQISPNVIRAAKERRRCGDLLLHSSPGETPRSRSRSTSPPLPLGPGASAAMASPSVVFGTAPRFVDTSARIEKERNPFVPLTKLADRRQAQLKRRRWGVKELQREDVLLFLVRYTHLMTELPDAIAAVEDHLYYLRRQLQLCPTRVVRRRSVLNDLHMNVYPKLHLFLRYVDQQARRSRSVLQLLSTFSGGTIHSGNVLDVYDAVGRCTGLSAVE